MSSLADMPDVEYSRTGELIKGQDKPKVRSRYDEDGTFTGLVLFYSLLMVSLAQQPQSSLGILVRSRICSMGFRMLSFDQSVSHAHSLYQTDVQFLDPTVLAKQVSPPHHPSLPTPSSNHARSTTEYKQPQKQSEQQPKPTSSNLGNVKKRSDGPNHKKARRLNLIKQDSRRLLMKRRKGKIFPKRSLWQGPRSPRRMSRKRKWVSLSFPICAWV
jgi:hypothetical protein